MARNYIRGIGLLVGMIFGAGIFALPFSFVRAGIFWGIFHFALALILMIYLHLWYGEVAYNTQGKHRFTGYAEIFLGKKAKWPAFLLTILTGYGALLVYGILGGVFLANFFSLNNVFLSLAVFTGGSLLIFFDLRKIAEINFYLTVFLLLLVVVIFLSALPKIEMNNFIFNGWGFPLSGSWFLPYGIWLFSLAGFAAIPETRDIFSGSSFKNFKKTVLVSILLCAVFYLLFIFTVVGVSGKMTTEDSFSGLIGILGRSVILAGSILGFLAIFTSFIALGTDLKNTFHYDLRLPNWTSWLCVALPPVFLFLSGMKNIIVILGVTGSVGLGLMGILVVLMRKKMAERKKEAGKFGFLPWLVGGLVFLGAIVAVISEL